MKRTLIYLLIFSLINLQMPMAFSQDNTGGTTQDDLETAQQQQEQKATTSTEKKEQQDEAEKATKANEDSKTSKRKGAGWTGTLTFAAIAIFAPFLFYTCPSMWSAKLFAAAGAYYVVMEIVNWNKYKEASEIPMEYKEGEDKDKQKEAFLLAEKQTREAAKAARSRSKHMKYAAYGMMAAAAVALIETYMYWAKGMGKCQGAAKASYLPDSNQEIYAFLMDDSPSLIVEQNQNSCNVELGPIEISQNSYLLPDPNLYPLEDNELNEEQIQDYISLLIPTAHAKDKNPDKKASLMGLIGGVIVSALAMYFADAKILNWLAKSNGIVRAVIFGATAGAAIATAKQIEEDAKNMDKRADRYAELAAGLGATPDGIAVDQIDIEGTGANPISLATAKLKRADDTPRKYCVTGNSSTTKINIDRNCNCLKTNSCKKTPVPLGLKGNVQTPSMLANTAALLKRMNNSLNNGNMQGADAAGSLLSKRAASIRKMRDSLRNKINDKRKGEGKKPIDFDRLEGQATAKMLNIANDAVNSLSPDAQKALSLIGNGPQPAPAIKGEKGYKPTQESSTKGSSATIPNFQFSDDDEQSGDDEASPFGDDGNMLDDFEVNTHDINPNSNADIFKVLTSRYIKTAYPVLFDIKKKNKEDEKSGD